MTMNENEKVSGRRPVFDGPLRPSTRLETCTRRAVRANNTIGMRRQKGYKTYSDGFVDDLTRVVSPIRVARKQDLGRGVKNQMSSSK